MIKLAQKCGKVKTKLSQGVYEAEMLFCWNIL
jgi:hypothetical protein